MKMKTGAMPEIQIYHRPPSIRILGLYINIVVLYTYIFSHLLYYLNVYIIMFYKNTYNKDMNLYT